MVIHLELRGHHVALNVTRTSLASGGGGHHGADGTSDASSHHEDQRDGAHDEPLRLQTPFGLGEMLGTGNSSPCLQRQ